MPQRTLSIRKFYLKVSIQKEREEILTSKIGHNSSHENNDDNVVGAIRLATSKNPAVRCTIFPIEPSINIGIFGHHIV
jgi:hypothetical protein